MFWTVSLPAERLLDDQSRPALRGAALADRLDDRLEDGGWGREVVDAIAPRLALLVELGQRRGEVVLALLVGEVHRDVVHAFGKRLPDVVTERIARVLLHRGLHPFPELVVRLFRARDADDGEVLGQEAAVRERVERGEQLAFRQVPGRAEDDEDAGVRCPPNLQPFEQRVVLERGGRHVRLPGDLWNIRDALVTMSDTGTGLCRPWDEASRITAGPGRLSRSRRP